MSFASRSGRWDIEDGRWGVVGSRYPISDLASPAAEEAPADGVREVGDYPDFSVRYGRGIALKSCCFVGFLKALF